MYMQYEKYVYKDTIKLIKPKVKLFYFDHTYISQQTKNHERRNFKIYVSSANAKALGHLKVESRLSKYLMNNFQGCQ